MSDLVPNGYTKDSETGYLVSNSVVNGNVFGVETKKRFLAVMEQEGSVGETCKALGISTRSVYDHLQIDEAFKRDYALCIRNMASKLETTMFKNGQRPQGYMDRITFLRRWFPNEWTPKTSISITSDTSNVDSLFSLLEQQGKIINVTDLGKTDADK